MRSPLARAATAVVLSAAVLTGSTGPASATGLLPVPTATLPKLPLPTLPIPTPPVPKPTVPVPPLPTTGIPTLPPPPGGVPVPPPPGGTDDPGSDPDAPGEDGKPSKGAAPKGFTSSTKPMIAGRPEVADLLDDESSPALLRASKRFLAADQGIAEIVGHQDALLRAVANAQRVVDEYTALSEEATVSRSQAVATHDRQVDASKAIADFAREVYRTGGLGSDTDAATLTVIATQLADTATRAEIRLGGVNAEMAALRLEYEGYAADYYRALQGLNDYQKRIDRLAAQRAAALADAQAARAGDVRQSQTRQVVSGQLGASIRAASAKLRQAGRSVEGSGEFARPGKGDLTSRYGPRFHPILKYTKLHTGADFGRADGTVYAADDGVVLFTVGNQAYGNMTVVDHGIIDGRSVTTMYAHQARFLVKEGQRVTKGQPIGVIGSTGYSTGPHLHFEVRDAGAVQNPMPWL